MIEVLGTEEASRKLRQVADATKGKEMRRAVRAGLTVVRKAAIRLAPHRTGTLKKNIGTSTKVERATRVSGSVGFRRDAWYGRLVETGHALVRKKKVIGHVPARPFLRPALEGQVNEVVRRVQEVFSENLRKLTRGNR